MFISSSSLEKKSLLRDNVDLLVSLADVYFRAGDTKNAILKFEQAQMLDPYLIKGSIFVKSVLWLCIHFLKKNADESTVMCWD